MHLKLNYFGTDGVRGRVGSTKMDPEFILKLGWAAGTVLKRYFTAPVVMIGKDTRISGYLFESVLEAGLTAAGVNVLMLGPISTPAVSYLTKVFRAQAGAVISASHNPYHDNGIKFFTQQGSKFPDAWEAEIEELLVRKMTIKDTQIGKVKRVEDASGRYIEYCKGAVFNYNTTLQLKIALDCANGAAYKVAPAVFRELGAQVITIADRPDGVNINQDCGSTHPEQLAQTVLSSGSDLGIALDGDGDRVIMVDHTGEVLDGDELLYILATNICHNPTTTTAATSDTILNQSPPAVPGVVGTIMSNLGLELSLKQHGIAFARSTVGDRHVVELLHQTGWWLGGENSGHLINLQISSTGDGIVSALQILKVMEQTGQTLHQLKASMRKYPQVLLNVACELPEQISQQSELQEQLQQYAQRLQQHGSRLVVRPSGTEPLIRIMLEGRDYKLLQQQAEQIATTIQAAIAQREQNHQS